MGNRLHVARKYDVQYSSYENFNWKIEEFHDFLDTIEIDVCSKDRTSDPCPWDFEIAKNDWIEGIGRLKNLNNLSEGHQSDITESLKSLCVSSQEMIEIMEKYLHEADPDNDYLNFSFF